MPNGVIGNTTDSGSVKSRFEPWLGNNGLGDVQETSPNFFYYIFEKNVNRIKIIFIFAIG